MTPLEKGFLLLTSHLGNPERKPMTVAQFRNLAARMKTMPEPKEDRELTTEDLLSIGCSCGTAQEILELLKDGEILELYLKKGERLDCKPISRLDGRYPVSVRRKLGLESPGCLWALGDVNILNAPGIALVGSRELKEKNRVFAEEVGYQAAVHGLTLISGNARGADRVAQESCLEAGGRVISVVADELWNKPRRRNLLYLSEEDYDQGFSSQRALSRNRVIHTLAHMSFVAQSDLGFGGTWDGTMRNLRFGWNTVVCYHDGSPASLEMEQMGAYLADVGQLADMTNFRQLQLNFFE